MPPASIGLCNHSGDFSCCQCGYTGTQEVMHSVVLTSKAGDSSDGNGDSSALEEIPPGKWQTPRLQKADHQWFFWYHVVTWNKA